MPPPAPRALLLWPQCTFRKGGINICITQTSLSFQGHTRTQSILAPLFQLQGLGHRRILLHSIKANICHLSHQSCLLTKQPFLVYLHSRWICLGVLQPIALLGQKYFISFTISLTQSWLFKPWSCRFIKVCGVKPQHSGSLHKCKENRRALLTLQNNSRDIRFQLSCALALGAGPREPRLLQTSPCSAVGSYTNLLDSFPKERAFVSKMRSLTSELTKR